MDCDLQHPPETLIKMYRLWEDGYQVIEGGKHPEEEKVSFTRCLQKHFTVLSVMRQESICPEHLISS